MPPISNCAFTMIPQRVKYLVTMCFTEAARSKEEKWINAMFWLDVLTAGQNAAWPVHTALTLTLLHLRYLSRWNSGRRKILSASMRFTEHREEEWRCYRGLLIFFISVWLFFVNSIYWFFTYFEHITKIIIQAQNSTLCTQSSTSVTSNYVT